MRSWPKPSAATCTAPKAPLFRITLTPPGRQQRTDKPLLLRALEISADEFATRFCRTAHTSWRLTCTPLRKLAAAA